MGYSITVHIRIYRNTNTTSW